MRNQIQRTVAYFEVFGSINGRPHYSNNAVVENKVIEKERAEAGAMQAIQKLQDRGFKGAVKCNIIGFDYQMQAEIVVQ